MEKDLLEVVIYLLEYLLNFSYMIYVYVIIVILVDCLCLKVRCWYGEFYFGEVEYILKSCRIR